MNDFKEIVIILNIEWLNDIATPYNIEILVIYMLHYIIGALLN